MRNLILLTNCFPYGKWEPYLETEIKYYDKQFDAIYVCSLQIRKEFKTKRPLPSDKFKVLPIYKTSGWIYILYAFRALFDLNLYREIGTLVRQKRLSVKRLIALAIYLSRSHYEASRLLRLFRKEGLTGSRDSGIIYSYRFEYQPYVGLLLQRKMPNYPVVARGHRFDLYEEERTLKYIPLRDLLLQKIQKAILISQDGVNYLTEKHPAYKNKLVLSRLGTGDHSTTPVEFPVTPFRIVSCSTIIPVKRLSLIVDALSHIHDTEIQWTHYGDGYLYNNIKERCETVLPPNISYEFKGHIDNPALLDAYGNNPYHLFINVSTSEGLPVSIMEAMSFGIPCLATNVGGTGEIVNGGNGMLVDMEIAPEVLADRIHEFATMDREAYQRYRTQARRTWELDYDCNRNYSNFMNLLAEIILEYNGDKKRNE